MRSFVLLIAVYAHAGCGFSVARASWAAQWAPGMASRRPCSPLPHPQQQLPTWLRTSSAPSLADVTFSEMVRGARGRPASVSMCVVDPGRAVDEPPALSIMQGDTRDDGALSSRPSFDRGGSTAVLEDSDFSVSTILKQLESIQQGTPKKIVILGTRHCSFLHQQIIELLSYALVLSENHIFTSGATGTHAAAIRGALRAQNGELLTVILPQTIARQPREIRELLGQVQNVIELGHDLLPLDAASRICNSELLSKGDQLIVFAFHDSKTLRETIEEAKAMSLLVTVLFLD